MKIFSANTCAVKSDCRLNSFNHLFTLLLASVAMLAPITPVLAQHAVRDDFPNG